MANCQPPRIAEEVLLFEEMMATNHPLGIAGFLHFVIPPNFQEGETRPYSSDAYFSAGFTTEVKSIDASSSLWTVVLASQQFIVDCSATYYVVYAVDSTSNDVTEIDL